MKIKNPNQDTYGGQRGAISVITALVIMFVLIGIAALAIDIGRIATVKNELQNAADAGALAGAGALYNEDGAVINQGANKIAYNTAIKNLNEPEEIIFDENDENADDIQRGHWSFAEQEFNANDSTTVLDLWNYGDDELDQYNEDNPFINAVRVVTRRDVTALFAKGFSREITAEAIAYLGFAGSVEPEGFDYPIAICKQSIIDEDDGSINCNIGRMLQDNSPGDTAVWTNFTQPCATSATPSIRSTMDPCGKGNASSLTYGQGIGVTNGVVDTVFSSLLSSSGSKDCPNPTTNNHSFENCWKLENDDNVSLCPGDNNDCGKPTEPWPMRLPVVDCSSGATNCRPLVGAVVVNVLWVLRDSNKPDEDAPCSMGDWTNDSTDGLTRWDSFVSHFDIQTPSGDPAPFSKKTVYFAPECDYQKPTGITGGANFGILAEVPVLVK